MKITINNGCTGYTLTVDGVKPSPELMRELAHKLIDQQMNADSEKYIFKELCEMYGYTEYDKESCEQCGHLGSTTDLYVD